MYGFGHGSRTSAISSIFLWNPECLGESPLALLIPLRSVVSRRVAFCRGDPTGSSAVNHAGLMAPGTSEDGVSSSAACVAFKKHPHGQKGKLVFLWGDECHGFRESVGRPTSKGPLVAAVLAFLGF